MRKNEVLLFLGAAITMLTIINAPAHAQTCQSKPPQINIKTVTTDTKVIRTKSSRDLKNMHGGSTSSAGRTGGRGGGYVGFKVRNEYEYLPQNGKVCVRLKRINIPFVAYPEIHIASNFARASCEHNAVMAHEQGHIRILRKFVREYSPKVKTHFQNMTRKITPSIDPVPRGQEKFAQNKIQAQIMAHINGYQNKIISIVQGRQRAHDTPAEYERVGNKCKKWDQKLSTEPTSRRNRGR
jgi:hypothetical protein